jgi:hypothetical protein
MFVIPGIILSMLMIKNHRFVLVIGFLENHPVMPCAFRPYLNKFVFLSYDVKISTSEQSLFATTKQ